MEIRDAEGKEENLKKQLLARDLWCERNKMMKLPPYRIIVFFLSTIFLTRCQVERPSAGSEAQQPRFAHADFIRKTKCTECHESSRPGPFKDQPHGAKKDCGGDCHIPQDNPGKVSGWITRVKYDHKPTPTTCFECHLKEDRPDTQSHANVPPTQCIGCHTKEINKNFTSWKIGG